MTNERISYYQSFLNDVEESLGRLGRQWRWFGLLRGGLFLLCLAALAAWWTNQLGWGAGWKWSAAGVFAAFFAVAYMHELVASKIYVSRLQRRIHNESLLRLNRDLRNVSVPQVTAASEQSAVSRDLDLLGDSSLFRLIGTVRTPQGIEVLVEWMFVGANAVEIDTRQTAVRQLRDEADWRNQFQLIAEQLSASDSGPGRFVQWCESPSWVERRAWIVWIARACLATLLVCLVGTIAGLIPLTTSGPIAMATTAISFVLSVVFAGPIHDIFNQISSHHGEVSCYRRLFEQLAAFPAQSGRLQEIQKRLFHAGNLRARLNSLGWLVWLANWRRNGILFLAYIVLQFLFFWDVHILELLERWKRRNAAGARSWFRDLGQWEALNALAKLSFDHPEWVFPTVRSRDQVTHQDFKVTAIGIGHPLIPLERRVDNDVEIGPPGTLLLVTGSNMSGKSTLLRTVGLNIVLAQMGGPVCAKKMALPTVVLATSMRISDSLADGVSFFMAELRRLKEVVDQAAELKSDRDRGQLFLLDEILQGTNSRERQIAVSRVIRQLLAAGSIGAVSTHDLELASLPELKPVCRPVYFCESFVTKNGTETMTFDYRMHPGVSPTTNALKLLELVGLCDPKAEIRDLRSEK